MTSESDPLSRLAAACGIGSAYHDIWNRRREVTDETRRALLRAMGHRADSATALGEALAEREARSWRPLPPVLVVAAAPGRVMVPVVVPTSRLHERRLAVLEREDGGSDHVPFVPAELNVLDRREVDGEPRTRCQLVLTAPRPGYHRLRLPGESDGAGAAFAPSMRLIVAPERCHLGQRLEGRGRVWGAAVQLYALRTRRNWGLGDLGDLAALAQTCGRIGAGVVGLNPLHALFPAKPHQASPYSPSSRAFVNPLYLDMQALDLADCKEARAIVEAPAFRERLEALRRTELVDHAAVARAKREVLECLWRHFLREHLARDDRTALRFREFQRQGGESLESYGVFEALQEHWREQDPARRGWPAWPAEYRRPDSAAVARFAREKRAEVEFHQWLQWHCDRQLAAAHGRGVEAGLEIGLCRDLAVSVDRGGFEAWREQDAYAADVSIGAPPDDFNLAGQDWGLPPLIPDRLAERAYAPYIECLRANMRHCGALRIDHVMGLMRAFWIPAGRPPSEGAYVRYPFQDLLGILALESRRNRCMIIGEDLGTVPDEVRAALGPAGILSYRVFFFMKQADGEFTPPADFPARAVITVTTHDLPTLAGYWQGRDLELRAGLGQFREEHAYAEQLAARARDRARLLAALEREKLLPAGVGADPAGVLTLSFALVTAIHRYIARSPSKVLLLQLEDVFLQTEQVNLPGTSDQYPNWRRKLSLDLESWLDDGRLSALSAAVRQERGD